MNGLGWNFMDGSWVLSSTRKNWLNFGGDLGIVRWVNEQKNTVIVVAYPDRGAGNNPEPFFFFFFFFRGVGSLSQPRLNIFTVGNMRVMICLGQGGLRSLSTSSWSFIWSISFIKITQCLYSWVHVMVLCHISCIIFISLFKKWWKCLKGRAYHYRFPVIVLCS